MPSHTGVESTVGNAGTGSASDPMLPLDDVPNITMTGKPGMAGGGHNRRLGQEIRGRE